MARKILDTTGNEVSSTTIGKINENFAELYNADASNTNWDGETVTANGLGTFGAVKLDTGTKTATATAGAATLNKDAGVITSEALTTAAGAAYTLTITNSSIAAADQVFASIVGGTSTAGVPVISTVVPAAGSVVIKVFNLHSADALNGTLKIAFAVFKN
jgi:hypothetical protein